MLMFGYETYFKYHLLSFKQTILVNLKFIDQGKFKMNIENDA